MDLLDRLLEHDRWTTRRVLAICCTLPPEQLVQPFDVGPGTLDATLRHMIANVQVWTDLMREGDVRPVEAIRDASITQLAALFEPIYADFAACAREVRDDGRWDATYVDTLDSPPKPKTFGGTIAHVLMHDMHHRAELLHMLGKLGVADLPEGDVLSWEAQATQM